MGDIFLYLCIALISSLVSVVLLCFLSKTMKLKREYTELIIPIVGAIVFMFVFQSGVSSTFTTIVESKLPGNFVSDNGDNIFNQILQVFFYIVISAIVLSQFVYFVCRKFGSKATALTRQWIFIGINLLLIVVSSIFSYIYGTSTLKEILNLPANQAPEVFFNAFPGLLLVFGVSATLILSFVLMIFNMIFYKITKEISFVIRRKKQ